MLVKLDIMILLQCLHPANSLLYLLLAHLGVVHALVRSVVEQGDAAGLLVGIGWDGGSALHLAFLKMLVAANAHHVLVGELRPLVSFHVFRERWVVGY